MRIYLMLGLALLLSLKAKAETPAAIAPLPPDATVDQVLDALDQRGQSLRDFTAKVSLTTGDPNIGNVTTRMGQVWFQKKGADDGRIRVNFDKKKQGRVIKEERVEYLLDQGWLTDRDYHKRAETRRQVLKPGEKINLLKLGEGPFPLPIGQKKEEVRKLFDVQKIATSKDDPADTIHLQLKPRPGTQFAKRFGAIDVWVNRTTHFPARIKTDTPDESDPHDTKLEDVQINGAGGMGDDVFKLVPVDQGAWSLHTEPYRE